MAQGHSKVSSEVDHRAGSFGWRVLPAETLSASQRRDSDMSPRPLRRSASSEPYGPPWSPVTRSPTRRPPPRRPLSQSIHSAIR